MYYVRFKNKEDYDKSVDFMLDKTMDICTTDDPAEFLAEKIVNQYIENKDGFFSDKEVEWLSLIDNKFGTIAAVSTSIKNAYKPGDDNTTGLIKAIIYEDEK